jgi:hypothetical protein
MKCIPLLTIAAIALVLGTAKAQLVDEFNAPPANCCLLNTAKQLARGGVVQIRPDGSQTLVTQVRSAQFSKASSEAARYLHGTLPNGMAFARNGDFLIANFGTDCLEVMTRDGNSRVLADSIDGEAIGKVNFVLRDSRDRIWVTISTRIKNWMHALRS